MPRRYSSCGSGGGGADGTRGGGGVDTHANEDWKHREAAGWRTLHAWNPCITRTTCTVRIYLAAEVGTLAHDVVRAVDEFRKISHAPVAGEQYTQKKKKRLSSDPFIRTPVLPATVTVGGSSDGDLGKRTRKQANQHQQGKSSTNILTNNRQTGENEHGVSHTSTIEPRKQSPQPP